MRRDSLDGLDGPGSNVGRGQEIFFLIHEIRTGSGSHPASYSMDTFSFHGVKRAGCVVDHSPP